MDLDRPLDDLIKSKRAEKRSSKPRGAGNANNKPKAAAGGARDRYAGNAPRSAAGRAPAPAPAKGGAAAGNLAAEATKIIISNLPADVNEAAVRDLLQSTVGPVRTVHMSYTAAGKSSGNATVIFKDKGSASKAHAAYNNRMIDNQRPMRVEIVFELNQIQSLASRVAPVPAARAPRGGQQAATGNKQAGGKGGKAAGARKDRPKPKSAEELDAEMSAYKDKSA